MRIGLEVHLQLPTRSKLFCACPTTQAEPNAHTCPVCLGFPGTRPHLNRRALEFAIAVAKLLNCTLPETSWFSRKTYFYPDLSKNFQITQFEAAVGQEGSFQFDGKTVRIRRVQLEEDPARIVRDLVQAQEQTFLDYNRSGLPLAEIVTEPDLESPEEARAFLRSLLRLLRYAGIASEFEEQKVRADANISMGPERVEVKNVTGLRNLERALAYEADRQRQLLDRGLAVPRETRSYDEARGVTLETRTKETEEDYGYIGEPDLPLLNLSQLAEEVEIPELPLTRAERLASRYGVEAGKLAELIADSAEMADALEALLPTAGPELVVSWLKGPIRTELSKVPGATLKPHLEKLGEVLQLLESKRISDVAAKKMIGAILRGVPHERVEELETSTAELEAAIERFLTDHPEVVADYAKDRKALNFVVGNVVQLTRGRFSTPTIAEHVRRQLDARLRSQA